MNQPNPEITAFWQAYQNSLPENHPHRQLAQPAAWGFGDNPELAEELGQLVYDGVKTATCSSVWEYEFDGDPLPKPGNVSIVLDGQGKPLCIIETTEITIRPFNGVDAQFAADEGEGDRSLKSWREGHTRFFGRCCARIGRPMVEDMPVVCERFQVRFKR